MKKIDMLLHFRLYLFELEAQDAKRSTGSNGKLADSVLRYGSLKNGYSRLSDIPCRARGKVDAFRRKTGKFEFKTGCGEVVVGKGLTLEDAVRENILPKGEFIFWIPFPLRFQVARLEAMQAMHTLDGIAEIQEDEDALALIEYHLNRLAEIAAKDAFAFTRDEFIDCLEFIGKNGLKSSLKVAKKGTRLNIQTLNPKPTERLFDFIEENEIPAGKYFIKGLD